MRSDGEIQKATATCAAMNARLRLLSKDEVARAIELEFEGSRRWTVIERLVRRWSRLDARTRLSEARRMHARAGKRVGRASARVLFGRTLLENVEVPAG